MKKTRKDLAVDNTRRQCKRYKRAIDASTDELICPLTLELPLEPVTAEDGKVYEREAIESHFASNGRNLKSPVTNEPIGRRLLPALQMRNAIEKLVESGAIGGDKAVRWKEELEKRKEVATIREAAEDGDADAMSNLAFFYGEGTGVQKDWKLAYAWYKKAADCGHVGGTAMVGWHYLEGIGVDKNSHLAILFLGRADRGGSELAAYLLGKLFCKGLCGLPTDPVEGKRMLRRVVNGTCEVKDLNEPHLELAREMLVDMDVPAVIAPEAS